MVKARTVTASPNTLYSCAVYSGMQLLFSTISLTSFFTFSASRAVFTRDILSYSTWQRNTRQASPGGTAHKTFFSVAKKEKL